MPLPFHRTYTFATQVIGMWRRDKRHLLHDHPRLHDADKDDFFNQC